MTKRLISGMLSSISEAELVTGLLAIDDNEVQDGSDIDGKGFTKAEENDRNI